MKSVTTFLTFEGRAEEAIQFYQDIFKNVEIIFLNRFGPETKELDGKIMQGLIKINDMPIIVSDSSVTYDFSFTPSMSFFIECDNKEEQINLYEKIKSKGSILMPLDDYGFSEQFAWVTDPFGVSWQINYSN